MSWDHTDISPCKHKSTYVRNDCHTQSILLKINKVTGVKCQIKSKPQINDLRLQKVKHISL